MTGCSSSLILPRGKEWCRAAMGNHQAAYATCAEERVQAERSHLLCKAGGGPQQAPCKDQGAVCSAASWLAVPHLQEKPMKVKDTGTLLQTPPCHPDRLLLPRRLLVFSHSNPLISLPKPSLLQEGLAAQILSITAGLQLSSGLPQGQMALGLVFPCFVPNAHWRSTSSPIPVPCAGPRLWKANPMRYREGGSHVLRPRESKTNTSVVAETSVDAHK